jgi:hypothetical protein
MKLSIDALAALVQAARDSDATPRTADDERPPHYSTLSGENRALIAQGY